VNLLTIVLQCLTDRSIRIIGTQCCGHVECNKIVGVVDKNALHGFIWYRIRGLRHDGKRKAYIDSVILIHSIIGNDKISKSA